VPACAVLTVARRLGDLVRRRPVRTPRRIAFVKLAEQGSTVIASSALRRAIRMVGRENVFFVVFEENRFILDVMGLLPGENVVAIRADGLLGLLAGTLSALRRLRRLRVDAVVDLEFFARFSAILAYLSGASSRVGFHPFGGGGPYRGDLMTHRLLFNPHLHTAQTFEVMVDALEIPPHRLPTFDRPPPPAHPPPPPRPPPLSLPAPPTPSPSGCPSATPAELPTSPSYCSIPTAPICCPCGRGPRGATSSSPGGCSTTIRGSGS